MTICKRTNSKFIKMPLKIKKINFEYLAIVLLAVFSGILISFYNLSILFILLSILFIIISFKYFNQVLFLLILYIPFQVALNISAGIDLASGRVLILYLFVVWVIRSLAEKRFVIRFSLQTLLILLFLFIAIFSILQAWDMERAFRKILVFLSIFPLYFIITSLAISSLDKKKVRAIVYRILKALIISGFILSLIGIIQFVLQLFVGVDPIMDFWSKFVSPIFYGNTFGAEVIANPSWLVNIGGVTVLRAFSLFPDPHMFSFYLGLLIPVVFAFCLCNKCWLYCGDSPVKPEYKWLHSPKEIMEPANQNGKYMFFNSKFLYFTLITMLLAEALTFSRGGYIGLIAGIGVIIILLWRYINFNKKIILGSIIGIVVLFISFTNQSIVSRFLSSFDFKEGSNTERIKNWNQGYEMFADNFLTGVGIGNYSIYLHPTVEYRTPIYAHNLYLDIGAEMGVFALLVWIALIGVTIWQLFKTGRRTEDIFIRALSFGLIGSLIWFSMHSFFDTAIYSPTILSIFVIIISLSVIVIKAKEN